MDGDFPAYRARWGPALDAAIWFPITKGSILKVGTRLHSDLQPAAWSVDLSYTIDPTKILNGVFSVDSGK